MKSQQPTMCKILKVKNIVSGISTASIILLSTISQAKADDFEPNFTPPNNQDTTIVSLDKSKVDWSKVIAECYQTQRPSEVRINTTGSFQSSRQDLCLYVSTIAR